MFHSTNIGTIFQIKFEPYEFLFVNKKKQNTKNVEDQSKEFT